MLIKKRYLMILSVAVISIMLGSLLYSSITQAPKEEEPTLVDVINLPMDEQGNLKISIQEKPLQIYKDSVKISIVDFKSDLWLGLQEFGTYTYPFTFNPKAQSFNVTDCWVIFELNVGQGRIVQYGMNGIALVPESLPTTTDETYFVKQITSQSFLDSIRLGVNYFTLALPVSTNQVHINHMAIFIEYEYLA